MRWSIAPTDEFVGVWIPLDSSGFLDSYRRVCGCLDSPTSLWVSGFLDSYRRVCACLDSRPRHTRGEFRKAGGTAPALRQPVMVHEMPVRENRPNCQSRGRFERKILGRSLQIQASGGTTELTRRCRGAARGAGSRARRRLEPRLCRPLARRRAVDRDLQYALTRRAWPARALNSLPGAVSTGRTVRLITSSDHPHTTVVSIRSASDRRQAPRVDALSIAPTGEFVGVWIPSADPLSVPSRAGAWQGTGAAESAVKSDRACREYGS